MLNTCSTFVRRLCRSRKGNNDLPDILKPFKFLATELNITILFRCKSAEEATALSKGCQDFLFDVEKSSKPVVAAIMGSCLGGGLETAMACHYRVAVDGKRSFYSRLKTAKLALRN